jgi:hypothetical protein
MRDACSTAAPHRPSYRTHHTSRGLASHVTAFAAFAAFAAFVVSLSAVRGTPRLGVVPNMLHAKQHKTVQCARLYGGARYMRPTTSILSLQPPDVMTSRVADCMCYTTFNRKKDLVVSSYMPCASSLKLPDVPQRDLSDPKCTTRCPYFSFMCFFSRSRITYPTGPLRSHSLDGLGGSGQDGWCADCSPRSHACSVPCDAFATIGSGAAPHQQPSEAFYQEILCRQVVPRKSGPFLDFGCAFPHRLGAARPAFDLPPSGLVSKPWRSRRSIAGWALLPT